MRLVRLRKFLVEALGLYQVLGPLDGIYRKIFANLPSEAAG